MSVYVFPHIVKDCPKIRNIPKTFLRSSENMAPGHMTSAHRALPHWEYRAEDKTTDVPID